jgi:PAS domain S-box-containing protein
MNDSINILIVEDYPPDVELAQREINKTIQSCVYRSVESADEYVIALKEFQPDLIITDYKLPSFDGLTALKIAQENAPLTPVIILTSAINEDTAVECMKKGATDYVIKEHIKRLGLAVVHALEERQLREERLRTAEALRESEERFRSLYENATIGIYRTTPEGRILMANPAAIRMLGYDSFNELTRRNLDKSGFKTSAERIEFQQRIAKEGIIIGHESAWIKKDGSTIHIRESARAIRDEKGSIIYYDGTFEDITGQKQAMEALSLLSHAVKSIGECISITDLENKLLFVNETFLKTYGYTEEEIIGKNISIIRSEVSGHEDFILNETLKGGWQGELLNRKKDGSLFPIYLSTSVISDEKGQPIALVGIASDITERKWAERALQVSEKKYRDIVTWAPIGIYQSTRSGKMLSANSSIVELLGYTSVDDLISSDMSKSVYFDEEDRKRFIKLHDACEENVALNYETRWRKKDGSVIWVLMTVHEVRDKSGETLYYEGFVFDITERKHAEEALRESEERYRLLVENSMDLVTEIDSKGNFLYVSPNVKTILGFEPANLVGTNLLSKVYSKDKSLLKEILGTEGGSVTYRYRDNMGEWHWFETSGRIYRTSSGEQRMVMVSRDITERRKSEQELDNSRKQLQHFTEHLEHVLEEERKRISRELHDDLGQLLTILKFDLSWLRLEGMKDYPDVKLKVDGMMDALNEALASVKRISKEIRPPQLDALGLGGAIQWDIDQIEKKTGLKGIVTVEPIEFNLQNEISAVLYRIFREALTNVVRHAQAQHVYVRLIQRLDSVILSIRDDGRGITKKEISSDISLGLVGIRERVRTINGSLSLEGKSGKGTMLIVEVPLSKKKNGEIKL